MDDFDSARLEQLCRNHLRSVRGDVAHDIEHVERVVANARAIGSIEGARMDVVLPAAWLHDCVSSPKDSPKRGAASRLAAAEALRLLRAWRLEGLPLEDIRHAIEAHSFSAEIPARSLEARVVQDADRLEALGAIGLARCLMLGGAMKRPLYVPADPFCGSREPDDRAATIDHFYTKLLRLSRQFQTATGRAEADRRTLTLQAFLSNLRTELAWASATHRPEPA